MAYELVPWTCKCGHYNVPQRNMRPSYCDACGRHHSITAANYHTPKPIAGELSQMKPYDLARRLANRGEFRATTTDRLAELREAGPPSQPEPEPDATPLDAIADAEAADFVWIALMLIFGSFCFVLGAIIGHTVR